MEEKKVSVECDIKNNGDGYENGSNAKSSKRSTEARTEEK